MCFSLSFCAYSAQITLLTATQGVTLGCILLGLSARLRYVQSLDTKNVMIDTSLCCRGSFFKNNLSILLSSVDEINSEIKRKEEKVCAV